MGWAWRVRQSRYAGRRDDGRRVQHYFPKGRRRNRAAGGGRRSAGPLLALPPPTYTGTPGDQLVGSDAERNNAIAKAQAGADALCFPRAI